MELICFPRVVISRILLIFLLVIVDLTINSLTQVKFQRVNLSDQPRETRKLFSEFAGFFIKIKTPVNPVGSRISGAF